MKYDAISIPASYGRLDSSPAPGTVAGIILGSVCGFIFLLYLIYLGLSSGRRFSATSSVSATSPSGTGTEVSEVRSSRRFGRGGRRRRDDVVEVEEGGSSRGGGSRIVVEESMTSRSHGHGREEGDLVEVEEEEEEEQRPARPGRGYRRDRYEDSEYGSSRY